MPERFQVNDEVQILRFKPWNYTPLSPDYHIDYPLYSGPYRTSYEWISDDQPGPRKDWKAIQHYKMLPVSQPLVTASVYSVISDPVFGNYDIADISTSTWPPSGYGIGVQLNNGLTPFLGTSSGGNYIPNPSNIDGLVAHSLQNMLPIIKSELSLVNSIIELKDFKSLPETLVKMRSFLFNKGKTIREFFRASADGYLQTEFNILPLLSDISSILTALKRTERRINDFITRAGRVQLKHFRFTWQEYPDESSVGFSNSIGSINGVYFAQKYSYRRQVLLDPTVFHAMIQYNYNYTAYQVEHAQLLAFIDAFGVKLDPRIIWNAIPWSFVIDWVAGVSRWLGQFSKGSMDPQINILRALYSVKRSRRIMLFRSLIDGASPAHFPSQIEVPISIMDESTYRRTPFSPDISSIETSGLTSKEVSLGAALVISRRRR